MTISEILQSEKDKGNIVVNTIDGPCTIPLSGFMNQPIEGILYDLNRDEATCLAFVDDDPTWVNNYASTQVIKYLVNELKKK